MATNNELDRKFIELLNEMFQLDVDLDFGVYRILKSRKEEISDFFDSRLLPSVEEAFKHHASTDRARLQKGLDDARTDWSAQGMDPDEEPSPKIVELTDQLNNQSIDINNEKERVYTHLHTFFSRYYDDGDFISRLRRKDGTYLIPSHGGEASFHWMTEDQYYTKTDQHLNHFVFELPTGMRVKFHLVRSEESQGNVKTTENQEKRFFLSNNEKIAVVDDILVIPFVFEKPDEKVKQEKLNEETFETILKAKEATNFRNELSLVIPDESESTYLQRALDNWTKRNTYDFFIHKNLRNFLREQLDHYLYSNLMRIDDIVAESSARQEQRFSMLKVIVDIATQIIDFLAQLEEFKKALWLKKKAVIGCQYCITLDFLSDELVQEASKNELQVQEWIELHSINQISDTLEHSGFKQPPSLNFLKHQPGLMVDTKHFPAEFKNRVLSEIESIDDSLGGILIKSENFHSLNLTAVKMNGRIRTGYYDPPYNSDGTPILYKNNYRKSSFCSLMHNRLELFHDQLSKNGILCTTIDDHHQKDMHYILDRVFGEGNNIATVVIRSNPSGRPSSGFAVQHEYAIFHRKSEEASIDQRDRTEKEKIRYDLNDEDGEYEWRGFIKEGNDSLKEKRPKSHYPLLIKEQEGSLTWRLPNMPPMEYNKESKEWENWEPDVQEDEIVVFPIKSGIEYRWSYGTDRLKNRTKQSDLEIKRDETDGEFSIRYKFRPKTKQTAPGTMWDDDEFSTVWNDPQFSATEHGTGTLKQLFGNDPFDFSKSVFAVKECLLISGATGGDIWIRDDWGGSATTVHGVIDLNREKGWNNKYVLTEMGDHFDTIVLPRIKKVVYSNEWKKGVPTSRDSGISHFLKYIELESYEDAIEQLELERTGKQTTLLEDHGTVKTEYLLKYMLGSESTIQLSQDVFEQPFRNTMTISRNSGPREVHIDLVETFNWLIGLDVATMRFDEHIVWITGSVRDGKAVLIIWREHDAFDDKSLKKWFVEKGFNAEEQDFDLVYVNGDSTLLTEKMDGHSWELRAIEVDFNRLMFEF